MIARRITITDPADRGLRSDGPDRDDVPRIPGNRGAGLELRSSTVMTHSLK